MAFAAALLSATLSADTALSADAASLPVYGLMEPGVPPKGPRTQPTARAATPAAIPDIYGPGAVLTAGDVFMKITNFGILGNPTPNLSSDPSGQWPGSSGVEYLNAIVLAVGALNPTATDLTEARRVSSGNEWRPATFDPEDRMYPGYEGMPGGRHLFNDDRDFDPNTGDPIIDEDPLDGRDNDGDGRIDEDFAALGYVEFSCKMRDDTPAAIHTVTNEPHVPLVLECQQQAWAYAVPGFTNFDAVQYTIYNRSGHDLDSMYIGFPADLDAGSTAESAGYYIDDKDLPQFPSGVFKSKVPLDSPLWQLGACTTQNIRINGFSVVDNDGDEGRTPGVVSLLLFSHTVDPLGLRAPTHVGFTSFRSFVSGTPYSSNGAPSTDQQRYDFMRSRQNVDADDFVTQQTSGQPGDYVAWCSIGPFLHVPDGGSVTATIGLAVDRGVYLDLVHYANDYILYRAGLKSLDDMFDDYPALKNAFDAQMAYEGVYERQKPGLTPLPSGCDGCESSMRLPRGSLPTLVPDCTQGLETEFKLVTDANYTWFNWDCDRCTGVRGFYQRHWEARSPPPSPHVNVSASYNYTDNPDRVVAGGDRLVTVAWDNVSETTPDPKTGEFDFRTYRIWKVSDWRRPPGSAGPKDDDWTLLSEMRLYDELDSNFTLDPATDTLVCPRLFVPSYEYPADHEHCADGNAARYPNRIGLARGGCLDTATVKLCLRSGDFWDRQSGRIMRPDPRVDCVRDAFGRCLQDTALGVGFPVRKLIRKRYPVGRYRFEDRDVKNGFQYFYSVTAGDSTPDGSLYGRRSGVESEAVTPQAATREDQGVWVVPNPYRGYASIDQRPSAWDLTPSATDPTGTHVDFMGLPSGKWTIRIYTVAGDLVAVLHSDDAVNASSRVSVLGDDGVSRPGFNRQQDNPNDGEARWNLISRNGQDVVSGIYVFVVESRLGQQRGKFVVIR